MTLFARINPDTQQTQVENFAAPPRMDKGWRPLTVEQQPALSPTQALVRLPIVFTDIAATQGWSTREKTTEELAQESEAAELALLKQMVDALTSAIQAGAGTAPTTAAEAFAQIQALKVQVLRLNRIARWLVRNRA